MNDPIHAFEQQLAVMKKSGLNVPAPAYTHFGGSLEELAPEKHMKVSFPLRQEHENPTGGTLGGMLAVFFDLVYGPFSYLIAKGPAASLDINTTFIKPLTTADERVFVEATLVSQSKSYLIMEGKARKQDGTLVATSTSRMRKL